MSATRGNAISNRQRAATDAFKCAKPRTVIVTTPNIEYNLRFDALTRISGKLANAGERSAVDQKASALLSLAK